MRKWIKLVAVALVAVVSQGETMSSPVPRNPRPPGGSQNLWGLTLFCWELTTYPEDNVFLQFETDLERTLEIYNRAMQHADDGVAGISHSNTSQPVLAGYAQLTPAQAHELERQIGFIGPPTITFEMLQDLMEEVLGLTLEELGAIFLRLAQAEREGRYDQEYEALAHAGLAGLREVLFQSPRHFPAYPSVVRVMMLPKEALEARAKEFIKAAALEYCRIVTEQLAPRQLEPQKLPAVLLVAGVRWLARIVIDVVAGFALEERMLRPLFAQEPIPDVLMLQALDWKIVEAIKQFSLQVFDSFTLRYARHHPEEDPTYYRAAAAGLLHDREDYIARLGILAALLSFAGQYGVSSPEFMLRMRLVLTTVAYMDDMLAPRSRMRAKGIIMSADENQEATLVFTQVAVEPVSRLMVSNVTAVRISLRILPRDTERYIDWFRQAIAILAAAAAEARRQDNTRIGRQLAAVIFKEEDIDPRAMRALVDDIATSGVIFGCARTEGYIIWREGETVWFSRVDLAPR